MLLGSTSTSRARTSWTCPYSPKTGMTSLPCPAQILMIENERFNCLGRARRISRCTTESLWISGDDLSSYWSCHADQFRFSLQPVSVISDLCDLPISFMAETRERPTLLMLWRKCPRPPSAVPPAIQNPSDHVKPRNRQDGHGYHEAQQLTDTHPGKPPRHCNRGNEGWKSRRQQSSLEYSGPYPYVSRVPATVSPYFPRAWFWHRVPV